MNLKKTNQMKNTNQMDNTGKSQSMLSSMKDMQMSDSMLSDIMGGATLTIDGKQGEYSPEDIASLFLKDPTKMSGVITQAMNSTPGFASELNDEFINAGIQMPDELKSLLGL